MMKCRLPLFSLGTLTMLITLFALEPCMAASSKGKAFTPGEVTTIEVPSPSLGKAKLPTGTKQSVSIYTPPSYKASKGSYSVIYYLHGFDGSSEMDLNNISGVLDGMYSAKSLSKEFIVVAPNGKNVLGGSFFVNSPVMGNWEDYLIKDVLGYVDKKYRTLKKPGGRAIIGFSMGGFAALNLGLKHPEAFSCAYGLSPGVFNEKGLDESQMFADPSTIESFIEGTKSLREQPAKDAKAVYDIGVSGLDNFTLAYGSAFAPDIKGGLPYMRFPYATKSGKLVKDTGIAKLWNDGFGGWDWKSVKFGKNLKAMRLFGFDAGTEDQYPWIPKGCAYLDKVLKRNGIPHFYQTYSGDHGGQLMDRLQAVVFPKLAKNMD